MSKRLFHGYVSSSLSQMFWVFVLQAVASIALGVIIFIYPTVLTILVSAFFIWLGIMAFLVALKIRGFKEKYRSIVDRF